MKLARAPIGVLSQVNTLRHVLSDLFSILDEPLMSDRMPRTRWGGTADGNFPSRGYFAIAQRDGVSWLIDPSGGRFLSKGVNTVCFDQDRIQNSDRTPYALACQRKYGNRETWRCVAAKRLRAWGFNTLGAWSDEAVANTGSAQLAFTPNLDLGMSFVWDKDDAVTGTLRDSFPDVFDPEFDSHIRQRARTLCEPRRDEQAIIGWFIDNELRWGPDWRGNEELLTNFLLLPPGSPGRDATLAWLRKRYLAFQEFNSVWRTPVGSWEALAFLPHIEAPYRRKPPYQRNIGDEQVANHADHPKRAAFAADCDGFAALVAERYFVLTSAAIKAADPNHLVLGCRFAYVPPPPIVKAAGLYSDVISFNCYDFDPSASIDAYSVSGKPCLVGEFSFRSADSGLPNSNGAGPLVATQAERATCLRRYVAAALQNPAIVGYHWFEHADQPAEGRFDGENSNFGTVTIDDEVYEELTRTMTAVNAEAEEMHAATACIT
jgi:agarase